MNSLVIVGAGGFGHVVADAVVRSGKFTLLGFLDDSKSPGTLVTRDHKILGGTSEVSFLKPNTQFVIAVGANQIRSELFNKLKTMLKPAVLVDSTAIISPSAVLGEGTIVLPGAVINANSKVGSNCIVDSMVLVDHDCQVGENSYIGPGSLLGSRSVIPPFYNCPLGTKLMPGTKA